MGIFALCTVYNSIKKQVLTIQIKSSTIIKNKHMFGGGCMDRTILHIDANSFFASVECVMNPQIADKPVAVVGDKEKRHGIVLAANYIAKKNYGIKTGDTVYMAERKCPELVKMNVHMQEYMKYSKRIREILCSYSDYVEPFSCDEAWVELRGTLKNAGVETAERIRKRIKNELGITVSVGVSFNKVFAKLGSDMKKPDAVTEITRENYKTKIWSLPVESMLYVGKRTKSLLNNRAIYTIGDLAKTDKELVISWLGKNGAALYAFANGYDLSPVREYDDIKEAKSIGNSTTCPRDLVTDTEVKTVLMLIAQRVSERMRVAGVKGREITVSVKDNELHTISHRCTLEVYTDISGEIAECAMKLFKQSYGWINPVRSIGISVGALTSDEMYEQLDLFNDMGHRKRLETIERVTDAIKKKFGNDSICKARFLTEPIISDIILRH